MAILKKRPRQKVVDLSGPDGNTFSLIFIARTMARELELGLDLRNITEEMMSGDYENAINVFKKYLGEYVELKR
jgi:hypothetical protein